MRRHMAREHAHTDEVERTNLIGSEITNPVVF